MRGAEAEARAVNSLLLQGRTILAQNYRIRGGEIDIVSEQEGVLIFTEVRHRQRNAYGTALESITPRKYQLMHRAALQYLLREKGTDECVCRLEVITIDGDVTTGTLHQFFLD